VACSVREGALPALVAICRQLIQRQHYNEAEMAALLTSATSVCLKQAGERIGRLRATAAQALLELLEDQVRTTSLWPFMHNFPCWAARGLRYTYQIDLLALSEINFGCDLIWWQ
jgi:hypothetical protein